MWWPRTPVEGWLSNGEPVSHYGLCCLGPLVDNSAAIWSWTTGNVICRLQVCSIVHDLDRKGQNLNVWAFLQAWLSTFYTLGCMWPTLWGVCSLGVHSGALHVLLAAMRMLMSLVLGEQWCYLYCQRGANNFFLGTFSPSQMVSLNSPDWPRTCSVDQA